jgi:Tol biopolymer transport system component
MRVTLNHPATVLGAAVILGLGCGDTSGPKPITEPALTGAVELTVSTSGANIDPDGYFVWVDDQPMIPAFGPNAVVTIPALSTGSHRIRLDGLAQNCSLTGAAERSVAVPSGGTVTVSFSVTCAAPAPLAFVAPMAFVDFNSDNAGIVVLTPNGYSRLSPEVGWDTDPAWSPDGSRIVFTSGRDRNSEIYVMNADGSNRVRLTTDSANNSRPAWSHDGARIAFVSRRDGNSEIYLMNVDGTGQFRLTYNNSYDTDPAWSPDGSSVAFVTDPHGASGGILVITVDGTETRRLTSNIHGDFAPAWSPDGTRIAFSGGLGGVVSAIFVMNADGSARTEYSGRYSYAADPTWSPDSGQIAFAAESCQSFYDCSTRIVVIRPDRTSITLTGEGVRQDPAWRP